MSNRRRLPIGRPLPLGNTLETQAPDVTDEPSTIERPKVEPAPAVISVVKYDEDVLQRQPRFKRFRRAVGSEQQKYTSAFQAVRAKPGFIARTLSFLVVYSALLLMITKIPSTIVGVIVFLVVNIITGVLIKKTFGRAFDSPNEPSDDDIIPREGFPKLKYWLFRLYGRADKVPTISVKQQVKVDKMQKEWEESESARIAKEEREEAVSLMREAEELFTTVTRLLVERIRAIYQLGIHPTICVANQKGTSAKSFVSVIMGNILSEILRSVTLLMSASTSTQSATAGNLAGLKRNTLTVRAYHRLIESGKSEKREVSFHELYEMVNNTKHGLFVVSEDLQTHERSTFSAKQWDEIYQHARRNCNVIILDTGNDDAYGYTVTTRAMRKADVVVITGNNGAVQTLDMTGTTIGNYLAVARQTANSPITPVSLPKNGEEISLLSKLKRPVVVFNGVDPNANLDQFMTFLNSGMEETGVTEADEVMPQVLGVRYDDYLFHESKALDFTRMDPATYQDYLVVLVAVFETAAFLRGVSVPERHPLIREVGLRIG